MNSYFRQILDFASAYPSVVYGLTGLVALVEALPVIGAFIPGALFLIAVGALVPMEGLDVWPILIMGILGALAGDSFGFGVGRHYGNRILSLWPLSRYPDLVIRSETFLHRHGGASIFLGRFIPPLRAFVPMVAGILRLSSWRFFPACALAALLWAPAHILPGIVVGASLSLAGAIAGRLLALLALLAALLWLAARLVRLAFYRGIPWLQDHARRWQAYARRHDSWWARAALSLLDEERKEVRGIALAGAVLLLAAWAFHELTENLTNGPLLLRMDTAVLGFLQDMRTPFGDRLMVAVTELGDPIVVIAVSLAGLLWLVAHRAFKTAGYWVAASGFAFLINTLIKITVARPRPTIEIHQAIGGYSFPSGHTTGSAVLYGFLVFLASRELDRPLKLPVATAGALLVVLIALSRLYLGAHWASDVLAGLVVASAWITVLATAYSRHHPEPIHARGLVAVAMSALILVGGVHIQDRHHRDLARYAPQTPLINLSASDWEKGGWQQAPPRRVDIAGELKEPLTLQWVDRIEVILARLEAAGWQPAQPWLPAGALLWLLTEPDPTKLPVALHLHEGRPPDLVMVKSLPALEAASGRPADRLGRRLVLRLWRDTLAITQVGEAPLLVQIGSVETQTLQPLLGLATIGGRDPDADAPRDQLFSEIGEGFLMRRGAFAPVPGWDGRVLLVPQPGR